MWGIKGLEPKGDSGSQAQVTVTGLVLRGSQVRTTKKTDKDNRVSNLIIRDADSSISVTCWGESCSTLDDLDSGERSGIRVGDVVRLINPIVKVSQRPNPSTSSTLELHVSKVAQVQKMSDVESQYWLSMFDRSVPVVALSGKEHSLVQTKQCAPGHVVSTRGVVSSLSAPRWIAQAQQQAGASGTKEGSTGAGQWIQRCGLVEPNSGSEFVITFWGLSSIKLLQQPEQAVVVGRTVMLVNGVRIVHHKGRIGGSFSEQSLLWIDPPSLRWLRDWSVSINPTLDKFFFPMQEHEAQSDSASSIVLIKQLDDLQPVFDSAACSSSSSSSASESFQTFYGKLSWMRLDGSSVYLACSSCHRKVVGLHCEAGCTQTQGVLEWKLSVSFMDCSAKVTTVLFGTVAEDLTALTAQDFSARLDEHGFVEGLMLKLLWRFWMVQFRVTSTGIRIVRIKQADARECALRLRSMSMPSVGLQE